jgi:hypothetical protein
MDFAQYAALGGLERLTIVAGAIIVGYWGYRLYAAEKKAGLVFMGLAVVVLGAALVTGASHMRSVGESYQLASATRETPVAPPAVEPVVAEMPAAAPESEKAAPRAATPSATSEEVAAPDEPEQAAGKVASTPEAAASEQGASEQGASEQGASEQGDAEKTGSPVRLATGQELGGRIVSVHSENVTLEWSKDQK